ncbi:MAG TPA: hypothetical protein VFR84_14355 [Candidatus Angelobacter sp.]|nr:hypothetical protein [Candidatus Angelobacter sp.]
MKILFSILLVSLLAGSNRGSGGEKNKQDWIGNLKQTPVSKLEAGLPETPFDRWFSGLIRPAHPKYQRTACDAADSSSGQCIIVSAEATPGRRVELTFALPSWSNANSGGAGPYVFVRGAIGPSDPRSKQPTRLVRKLSDLQAMLR